jgi:hypothetical protein
VNGRPRRADPLERHDRVHDGNVRAVGRHVAAAERDRMALADEREVPRRLAAIVIVLAAAAPARVLDDQELLVVFLDR